MKNKLLYLLLICLMIVPFVTADKGITVIGQPVPNPTYVDVSIGAEGDVFFNADLDSEGDNYVYINGEIANPTYEITQVTQKSTNKRGIFSTLSDLFKIFFGEQRTSNLDEEEIEALNYLNKFRQSIIEEVYYTQIQPLQLEIMAQRKINQRLTQELNDVYEEFGWEVNKHGLECYGYLRVMIEENTGVRSVTCLEGNETQTWYKEADTAVMVKLINSTEELNVTNSTEELNMTS